MNYARALWDEPRITRPRTGWAYEKASGLVSRQASAAGFNCERVDDTRVSAKRIQLLIARR